MTNFSQYLTDFLDHLQIEKNRSPLTRRNYDFYLRRFLDWAKISDPKEMTPDRVRQYRLHLHNFRGRNNEPMKVSTQNYHLIALRSFLKYLAKRDVKTMAPEKIELARQPDREVAFLSGNELERLLEQPLQEQSEKRKMQNKGQGYSLLQLRDKAILETLFSTGLRVSELAGLKRDQVDIRRDECTVRGKGKKLRVVFLSEQARYWLKKYLDARRDMSPYLFTSYDRAAKARESHPSPAMAPSPSGGRRRAELAQAPGRVGVRGALTALTPRSIQRILEQYARRAGIMKNVSPHTLRHSFATDLLRNGADIRSVQALLGHSSITTTQIYTHITDAGLREAHRLHHRKSKT